MFGRPKKDWYLREWMAACGVRFPHAFLQEKLDYSDGKASNVLTGKKRYDRDIMNEIADALNIQPYELLMHPEEAMGLRKQVAAALDIARQQEAGKVTADATETPKATTKRRA
jgi:hypothetical protein